MWIAFLWKFKLGSQRFLYVNDWLFAATRWHFPSDPITQRSHPVFSTTEPAWMFWLWKRSNRPFYSCVLSCLAFEWKWGWRWPCFDRNFPAFLMLMMLFSCKLVGICQYESSKVSIKTRSTPASLSFKGQATKHTTVKWSITTVENLERWRFESYEGGGGERATPGDLTVFPFPWVRNG